MRDSIPTCVRPWSDKNIYRPKPDRPDERADRKPYPYFGRIYQCCFRCPLADCKAYSPAYCDYCIAEKEVRNVAK